jgi:hypothetical protein
VTVWGYPIDKQKEVQAKRVGGHNGGKSKTESKSKAARSNWAKLTPSLPQAEPKLEPNGREGKGREREGKENRKDLAPPAEEPDKRHHAITSQWGDKFKRAHGTGYSFAGKDAATLKRFLSGSKCEPDAFLDLASKAWERTRCDRWAKASKHAATIHGLCTFFNEIVSECNAPLSAEAKVIAAKSSAATDLAMYGNNPDPY